MWGKTDVSERRPSLALMKLQTYEELIVSYDNRENKNNTIIQILF
jgi:hypothetical protein